jgi:CDP-glycerol glycerophosphotransferase
MVSDLLIFPIWILMDRIVQKKCNYWAFPVHPIKSDQFIENSRAIFEFIKKDAGIKKIVFCRNKINDFQIEDAENTEFIYNKSLKALWLLLQCKVVIVTNSISMEYSWRWEPKFFSVLKVDLKRHIVVNLSHGISLKKINAIANKLVKERSLRVKYREMEPLYYSGLIASSKVDSYAMAAMYYPIRYENVWLTGLPENDFLKTNISELPSYLCSQIRYIEGIKMAKKLIVYAPTYRQIDLVIGATYYRFSESKIIALKKLLKKYNAILGFRMHYFVNSNNLLNIEDFIDNEYIYDLGHEKVSDIAPIIREADMVISDYSSVLVEAIYRTIPVIGFAYDLENYREQQNGLLYDFEMVFPGPVVTTFSDLLIKIEEELANPSQVKSEKYSFSQKFFYEFTDARNSERVVSRIKNKLDE